MLSFAELFPTLKLYPSFDAMLVRAKSHKKYPIKCCSDGCEVFVEKRLDNLARMQTPKVFCDAVECQKQRKANRARRPLKPGNSLSDKCPILAQQLQSNEDADKIPYLTRDKYSYHCINCNALIPPRAKSSHGSDERLIAYCSDNKCQKARSEKKHKIALEKGTNIRRPRHGESFAELSPAIAALQHPNCKIDLKSLKLNSNEYALFSCESCRIGVLKQLCKARKMVKFFCVSSLCKEKKRAHIRTQDWKTRIEKSGSFQANYPLLAKEWVKSVEPLDLLPSDVTVSSTAEVKWRCHVNKKHIWTGSVDQRSSNPGCPMCNSNVSRQQLRLHAEITGLLGITAKVSPKLKIGKRRIEVDIPLVLDGRKIAIELDGYRWHVDKRDADQDKNRVLSEAGWTVIRIRDNRLSDVKLSYSDLTVYINSNCYYAQDWRDAIASTFLFITGKDLTNYSSYRFEDAYLARLKFYKLGGQ